MARLKRSWSTIAEMLLNSIGFSQCKTMKVCEIIANHHSPSRHDYVELKILKEADRIVNKLEGNKIFPW